MNRIICRIQLTCRAFCIIWRAIRTGTTDTLYDNITKEDVHAKDEDKCTKGR